MRLTARSLAPLLAILSPLPVAAQLAGTGVSPFWIDRVPETEPPVVVRFTNGFPDAGLASDLLRESLLTAFRNAFSQGPPGASVAIETSETSTEDSNTLLFSAEVTQETAPGEDPVRVLYQLEVTSIRTSRENPSSTRLTDVIRTTTKITTTLVGSDITIPGSESTTTTTLDYTVVAVGAQIDLRVTTSGDGEEATFVYNLLPHVVTGGSQEDPVVPPGADWTFPQIVDLVIPNPNDPIWADPPFASAFIYELPDGSPERFTEVTLPTGFTTDDLIEVAAPRIDGGTLDATTTASSGPINLLALTGRTDGVKKFEVRFLDGARRPDVAEDAPYPVGLKFSGLTSPLVRVSITPRIAIDNPPTTEQTAARLLGAVMTTEDVNILASRNVDDTILDAADLLQGGSGPGR